MTAGAVVPTGTGGPSCAVLAFEEVTFAYRSGTAPVLDRLTLRVGPGTATVVLGPNGTGKSTLLHLASGWLRPGRGRVLLDGRPVPEYPRPELGRALALVPQSERTPFDYTVVDHVLLARAPHLPTLGLPGPADRQLAHAAVLTTHEPDVAAAVATDVVLIRQGQVYRAGPRDEVFTAEHLTATYGVDVELARVNGRQVVLWTRG